MDSKKCSLRPMGQRSIDSTFLFRASSDCKEKVETKAPSKKGSHLSLSDFLNRKLHRSSVLPSSVPGKKQRFSSPIGEKLNREISKKEGRELEANFLIDDDAFRMFKNVEKDSTDSKSSCSTNERVIPDLQQTTKRKSLFESHEDKLKVPARKRLVVLGEGLKPLQSSTRKNICSSKTAPFYNHYENGGSCVDNEEVGCNEVWEGVGCTTLGGLEWH